MDQWPEVKPRVGQPIVVTSPDGSRALFYVMSVTPKEFTESGFDEIALSSEPLIEI